ncbi:MAG: hypothetical protein ABL907_18160 [Hyphomicrobium sp.]
MSKLPPKALAGKGDRAPQINNFYGVDIAHQGLREGVGTQLSYAFFVDERSQPRPPQEKSAKNNLFTA